MCVYVFFIIMTMAFTSKLGLAARACSSEKSAKKMSASIGIKVYIRTRPDARPVIR